MGRLLGGFSQQLSESTLQRWLTLLREEAERDEALEVARRLGRLGPRAQEAAAEVVARIAGSDAELRAILRELESWSRRQDLSTLTHFLSALRARSTLPHPAEPKPEEEPDS